MDEQVVISHDKKNPTWAWVHDSGRVNEDSPYGKRIILDIFNNNTCRCVDPAYEEEYIAGDEYQTEIWNYYKIIQLPQYRAFNDAGEFIRHCRPRSNMCVVSKNGLEMGTLVGTHNNLVSLIKDNGIQLEYFRYIFDNYTWLDGTPIGVLEADL